MTDTVFAICVIVVFLLACAAGAVFGHSITEEFRRHRRTEPEPDDEYIDLLKECSRKHGLPAPPPPPVGGSGQATAWDAEDPQVPQCPLDLPAPSANERLRIWTHTYALIAELPIDAKQREEGLVRVQGASAEHAIVAALHRGELTWLTVDMPRGRWMGRIEAASFGSVELSRIIWLRFSPECPLAGFTGAGWSG